MQPQLSHLLANEHSADLRRAAERARFARLAKHESLLSRLIARLCGPKHSTGHRAPARLGNAEPATGATDAATAEA